MSDERYDAELFELVRTMHRRQAAGERPGAHEARRLRLDLWEAAMRAMHGSAGAYDPSWDHRVKWAGQWLDVCEGARQAVDPAVQETADLLLNPTPEVSYKALAAGEGRMGARDRAREFHTLAQGS